MNIPQKCRKCNVLNICIEQGTFEELKYNCDISESEKEDWEWSEIHNSAYEDAIGIGQD